jgi:hypothetical protein
MLPKDPKNRELLRRDVDPPKWVGNLNGKKGRGVKKVKTVKRLQGGNQIALSQDREKGVRAKYRSVIRCLHELKTSEDFSPL